MGTEVATSSDCRIDIKSESSNVQASESEDTIVELNPHQEYQHGKINEEQKKILREAYKDYNSLKSDYDVIRKIQYSLETSLDGAPLTKKELSPDQEAVMKNLGNYVNINKKVRKYLNLIPEDCKIKTESAPLHGLSKQSLQWGAGIALVGASMVGKNVAWYGSRFLPSNSFGTGALRTAASFAGAMILEYPAGTLGQRLYREAGGEISQLNAGAIAFDMAAAGCIEYGISKYKGSWFPWTNALGFAGAALGGFIGSGVCSDIVKGVTNRCRGGTPVDKQTAPNIYECIPENWTSQENKIFNVNEKTFLSQKDGAYHITQGKNQFSVDEQKHAELYDACEELVRFPCVKVPKQEGDYKAQARAEARALRQLPEGLAPDKLAAMVNRLQGVDGELTRAAEMASAGQNSEHVPEYAKTHENSNLDGLNETLEKLRVTRDKFAKKGGLSWQGWAILGSMAAGGIGGCIAAPFLREDSEKALALGLASTFPQALANLGQFIGGAKSSDGLLTKAVLCGVDDPIVSINPTKDKVLYKLLSEENILPLASAARNSVPGGENSNVSVQTSPPPQALRDVLGSPDSQNLEVDQSPLPETKSPEESEHSRFNLAQKASLYPHKEGGIALSQGKSTYKIKSLSPFYKECKKRMNRWTGVKNYLKAARGVVAEFIPLQISTFYSDRAERSGTQKILAPEVRFGQEALRSGLTGVFPYAVYNDRVHGEQALGTLFSTVWAVATPLITRRLFGSPSQHRAGR